MFISSLIQKSKTQIISILIIFSFANAFGQKSLRDSLLVELSQSKDDSIKVEKYFQLTREYLRVNADSSNFFLEHGVSLSRKIGYKYGIALGDYFKGLINHMLGDYEVSLVNLESALQQFIVLNNKEGMARAYLSIGEVLLQESTNDGITYIEKSLKIFENINNLAGISDCYNSKSIGPAYRGEFEKAINLIQKALNIRDSIPKSEISTVFDFQTSNYDINNNLGFLYFKKKEYEKSNIFFHKSLNESIEKDIFYQRAYTLVNLGQLHEKLGNLKMAEEYGKEALKVAIEHNFLDDKRRASLYLKNFYKSTGNYKEAFKMSEVFSNVKDTLNVQLVAKNALKIEHERDLLQIEEEQKRKNIIAEKKDERQRLILIWVVTGLIVTVVFVVFVYYKLRLIRNQNVIIERQRERMEKELVVAHDIQMSMIPRKFPVYVDKPEFDLYGTILPAREVGGDFYDFYMLDEKTLFLCIGDVSGKGAGAALFMALAKSVTKAKTGERPSPSYILTELNNEISQNNDSYMFVTMFAAVLDISTGKLTYTNAGHNPTLIKKANGNIELLEKVHGPVIAAMEGISYNENQIQIEKDDLIVLYTDGVTEAMSIENELYSDQKFQNLIERLEAPSPKSLTNIVVEDVMKHTGDAEQFDDITLLTLKFNI